MATERGTRVAKQTRSAETRERLLEAAIVTLCKRGYADTTTATIAEEAEVTRGALQYHFASREALLEAALDHLADRRCAAMRQALEQAGTDVPTADALDLLRDHSFETDLFAGTLEFFLGTRRESGFKASLERYDERISAQLLEVLEYYFGKELVEDPEGDLLLKGALNLMRGLSLMRYVAGDSGIPFTLGESRGERQWEYWRDRIAADIDRRRAQLKRKPQLKTRTGKTR